MPPASWPLHDAKNRFSSVVAAARRGEPQLVTRHGRPVAVVLAVEDYARLRAAGEARPGFLAQLMAMPQGEGDEELFSRLEVAPRPAAL